MEKEMDIATWLRMIGELSGMAMTRDASREFYDYFIGKIGFSSEEEICMECDAADIRYTQDIGYFDEAKKIWLDSWSDALAEIDERVKNGADWEECIGSLRLCENGYRPIKEGFVFDDCYFATLADLLYCYPWYEYLNSYNNGDGDSYYTVWESYCDID